MRLPTHPVVWLTLLACLCVSTGLAQPYINEFSNGSSGSKEFYEIVVDGTPGGFIDIRGWILDDHSGYFGCASGNGIASGHLRFANISTWQCVKVGSIILIYNPSDVNSAITAADDYTDANGDYLYVLPINATGMFQTSTSLPSSSNCNDFSGTLSTSGAGTNWSCIALGNGGDAAEIVNPTNTSVPHHAISYGSISGSSAIHFGGNGGGKNYSFTNGSGNNYALQTNWTTGNASTFDTPGAPNNNANNAWIQGLRANFSAGNTQGCPPFTTSFEINNLGSSLTATWNFGDGSAAVQGDSVTHTFVNNGTYNVVVTVSSGGCSYADTTTVTVAGVEVNLVPVAPLCHNDAPVSLSGTPTGGTFFGSGVSGTQFDPSVAGIGTHAVGYTMGSGSCADTAFVWVQVLSSPTVNIQASGNGDYCQGDQVQLSATGNGTFAWSTGQTSATITVTQSGAYIVSASASCGTAQDTHTVAFNPLPNALISSDDSLTICNGDTVTLTASGGQSYAWSTGAQNASTQVTSVGTYFVTAYNDCGWDATSVYVAQVPEPPFTLKATKDSICPGESTVLSLFGSQTSQVWSQGAITAAITVTKPGTYSVTFSGVCNERKADIEITGLPNPKLDIQPEGPIYTCPGDSVILSATHEGWLYWNTGARLDQIKVAGEGMYVARSETVCGVLSDTIEVLHYPTPEITLSHYPQKNMVPANVEITADVHGGVEILHWNLDSLTLYETGNSIYQHFEEADTVNIQVWVQDEYGCLYMHSKELIITDLITLYIPKAFTPNGNGRNEIFEVRGTGIYDLHLEIYDRWGRQITAVNGQGEESVMWDGKSNGVACPKGIYAFILDYKTVGGGPRIQMGSVTLLR